MEAHEYNVDLLWKIDRRGILSSEQLNTSIEVATPPQFPGGIEGLWSPEHLITAAVSSCFMTTFLSIADKSRLAFESFSCSAKGILNMCEGQLMMTEILLHATLKISEQTDSERAEKILEKAEKYCLISNSIKSKVSLTTTIS